MAIVLAQKTGNWSDTSVWPGRTLPGSGDQVQANGYTVTVNQNITVASLRTTAEGGSATGGQFTLTGGTTITADLVAGSSRCGYYTGTGTIYIVGNLQGGSGSSAYGFYGYGASTIHLTGNATGGSGQDSYGLYSRLGNTSYVTGNLTGGSGANAYGGYCASDGEINVVGNVTGGSNTIAAGLYLNSTTSIVTITGNLYSAANGARAVIQADSNGFVPINGNLYSNAQGTFPISGRFALTCGSGTTISVANSDNPATTTTFYLASDVGDPPAVADVRDGVDYHFATLTGTLKVPPAGSVALGVPVDATTGTAALTAADLRAALGLAAADLDDQLDAILAASGEGGATPQQIWEYATRTLTEGGGGATPQQIWEYETRALTDKAGFSLDPAYDPAKAAASQASVDALEDLSAQQVWEYETRALTSDPPPSVEAIATAVLAAMVESDLTLKQALRLILAPLAGKVSGATTTTITIRNPADTRNRIVATCDAYGNRSSLTYDTSD